MDYFYLPNIDYTSSHCILPKEESRHIVRVLRKSEGDAFFLVDGKGSRAMVKIVDASQNACEVSIENLDLECGLRPYKVRLCVAPTKNISRYEWLLEKATEIGIDEIIPIYTAHSERRKINEDRLNKILISAMKQSQKSYLPVLHTPVSFDEFMEKYSSYDGDKYIAHCNGDLKRNAFGANYKKGQDICILVGPEGDFSEEEVIKAMERGYKGVHLGQSRLRTETAGVVMCATIYQHNF